MLLAELNIRHTRRHMPTRRIALESSYLPMTGAAHGAGLIAAVVGEYRGWLDDEQMEMFGRLVDAARDGLRVPSIVLRHRLQTDTHGLDRSRHSLVGEDGRFVVEIDVHGAPLPQLIGTVYAAATLPPTPRNRALRAVRDALDGRLDVAPDVRIRRLEHGHPGLRPPPPGISHRPGAPARESAWAGVPSERRWAMEVLGMTARLEVTRSEVNRRYRRLLRDAHPDHGGVREHAAERIAELGEARRLLLDHAGDPIGEAAGADA